MTYGYDPTEGGGKDQVDSGREGDADDATCAGHTVGSYCEGCSIYRTVLSDAQPEKFFFLFIYFLLSSTQKSVTRPLKL